ncbi:MAG: type II toxin-antitoxin system VapC family toxin [Gammaproteobacteria bacterium]|nr:type II toxin-antitoxin system VapC family toxin [Gammaproteobacteria bacterium]
MGVNSYLLDTHTFLWWLFNDGRLSYNARDIIKDNDNQLFLSAASAWEIATKHRNGKLPEAESIVKDLPALLKRAHVVSLDITLEDALLAGSIQYKHRDPIDRMIFAQGQLRNFPIITNDPVFNVVRGNVIW